MRELPDARNPFVNPLPAFVYRHPFCQSLATSIPEPCPAAAHRLTVHAHVHLFPSTLHLYGQSVSYHPPTLGSNGTKLCIASAQHLPKICVGFLAPAYEKQKLKMSEAMGRVESQRSPKHIQILSNNPLTIVPKCT